MTTFCRCPICSSRRKKNPISEARARSAAATRLRVLREDVRSGATEMVGRTYRGASGKIEGRFRGGFSTLYPELKRAGLTPSQAAAAVERGKGKRYRRLLAATMPEVEKQYGKIRKTYVRPAVVPPHKKLTKSCKACRVMHSTSEHRFHGPGAFHSTHLFGFNPPLPVVRYVVRPTGSLRGWYVWAVVRSGEAEQWAEKPYAKVQTKKEAESLKEKLNGGLSRVNKKFRHNPRLVKIYGRVETINAQKTQPHRCDAGCKNFRHRYYHDFKPGAKMYGLPNGDILITTREL